MKAYAASPVDVRARIAIVVIAALGILLSTIPASAGPVVTKSFTDADGGHRVTITGGPNVYTVLRDGKLTMVKFAINNSAPKGAGGFPAFVVDLDQNSVGQQASILCFAEDPNTVPTGNGAMNCATGN